MNARGQARSYRLIGAPPILRVRKSSENKNMIDFEKFYLSFIKVLTILGASIPETNFKIFKLFMIYFYDCTFVILVRFNSRNHFKILYYNIYDTFTIFS